MTDVATNAEIDPWNRSNPYIDGYSAEQLIHFLANNGALPGSVIHEAVTATIQLRIAEMNERTATQQLQAAIATARWAKVQGLGTFGAMIVALVALLVAIL
jgi:hypothetical protein